MKRGRKPKPAKLKLLQGNPGKRRLPAEAPAGDAEKHSDLPTCPPQLTTRAAAVWGAIVPQIARLVDLQAVDETVLALYCQSYANWLDCIEGAKENGLIVKVNGQAVTNPYLTRADREAERCRKLLAELGGSPAARASLCIDATPEDDLSEFLHGTGT